ncbi:MAG: circadian clock protein KaiC, partial [Desulfosalsimonas sp.]
LDQEEMVELGGYNLNGLFIRIEYAIDSVGAQRVVIDGIETLFSYLTHEQNLRAEIKRLFQWLKKKGVTAIITAESDEESRKSTRHEIEEFLSDCVIFLDQRIQNQVAVRRLHIVKYRGTMHGTNEYPFLVTESGISVLPITALGLDHEVPSERISTGVQQLDNMLGGKGYYRGSSILISGTAGTGKSSFAGYFAKSVCRNRGRCIYFAFEESPSQIIRNMESIGLDLQTFQKQGLLHFHASRPTVYGLEMHLLAMNRIINEFAPDVVILDPISNLTSIAALEDIKLMFLRILDHLKKNKITALCTNLTKGGLDPETTEVGVSSIMDTWILLENLKKEDKRQRLISVVISRGMAHSNSVHSFDLTDNGIVIYQE